MFEIKWPGCLKGKTYIFEIKWPGCLRVKTYSVRSWYVSGNTPCDSLTCGPGEECHVDRQGNARCNCPPPCEEVLRPVCGNDLVTYDNICELRRQSCLGKKTVSVMFYGECGKWDLEIFFILNRGTLMHACIIKIWPSLFQIMSFVNWTLRNKLQQNSNENTMTFIRKDTFENVCKMVAIFFMPHIFPHFILFIFYGFKFPVFPIYCCCFCYGCNWYQNVMG